MSEKEIQKVAAIFQNLGAAKEKAETMASQLIKRAEQLAKQNDSSKLSELQTLLETAICGAQGTLKPDKKAFLSKNCSQTAKKSHFLQKMFDQSTENEEQKAC